MEPGNTSPPIQKKQSFNENDSDFKDRLEYAAKRRYASYTYPHKLLSKLVKVSDYCKDNNIKLIFFIPPNYIQYDKKIAEYGLSDAYNNMLIDLNILGKVANFNLNTTKQK